MSTTGDGDPAPGRQEGPAGAAGAQAGAREGVDLNSAPRRGDAMPEAEAGEVAGASGGLREEAMEGWSDEEDSDIGPAEEEEEEEEGVGRMVDARHFPMSDFRLTFVDLMHSVLHRFHYNNHILVRSPDRQVPVQRRTQPRLSHHSSAAMAEFPEVQVPSVGPAAGPAEEAQESEESSSWEMAQEPAAPAETTECQDENSKAAAQGTESEGKEKEYNKKQEEPEKDLDPATDKPRKSSLED
ncbi:cancer/testis antigen 47A-like [Muntiacus reevesi]|uniref:cancer/testis antigen 47A-like n=1 Tax=Muntiacus reevesi TaxID=9886 RepID=UPI0033072A68